MPSRVPTNNHVTKSRCIESVANCGRNKDIAEVDWKLTSGEKSNKAKMTMSLVRLIMPLTVLIAHSMRLVVEARVYLITLYRATFCLTE